MNDDYEIGELLALWGQYEADRVPDEWAALFTEDGRYTRPGGQVLNGRQEIYDHLVEAFAERPAERVTMRIFGPSIIHVNGEEAESATDFVAYHRDAADKPWEIVVGGRAECHYRRLSGKWYFSEVVNRGYFRGSAPRQLPRLPRR